MKRALILGAMLFAMVGFAEPATKPSTQPAVEPGDAIAAYKDGRFADAIRIAGSEIVSLRRDKVLADDPRVIDLLHVQLAANLKLSKFPAATPIANQLFPHVGQSRSMLVNVAICDVRAKSYVERTAKRLRDFATANPTDEEIINLWGASLVALAKQAKPSEMSEQESAYRTVDGILEQTKPGLRRWGDQWLKPDAFAAIEERRRRASAVIEQEERGVELALHRLEEAKEAYNDICRAADRADARNRSSYNSAIESASRRVASAKKEYEKSLTRLDKANDQMPRPTWLPPVTPADPEFIAAK